MLVVNLAFMELSSGNIWGILHKKKITYQKYRNSYECEYLLRTTGITNHTGGNSAKLQPKIKTQFI
jgi:hypothetical protein